MNNNDNTKGYIKLHRSLLDSPIWTRSTVYCRARAWVDLLLHVNHKKAIVHIGNNTYEVKPGETVRSLLYWSKRWRWSRSKVKRYFDFLVREDMIKYITDTKTTHLTVCKWESYNGARTHLDVETRVERELNESCSTNEKVLTPNPEQISALESASYNERQTSNEHQTNIKRTSNEHQTNTNKNKEKDKNEKKGGYAPARANNQKNNNSKIFNRKNHIELKDELIEFFKTSAVSYDSMLETANLKVGKNEALKILDHFSSWYFNSTNSNFKSIEQVAARLGQWLHDERRRRQKVKV